VLVCVLQTVAYSVLWDVRFFMKYVVNCHIFLSFIYTRDVNFVFFQKSILVLKKNRFFFDYRICVLFAVDRRYIAK